jgi:hypothetical protein
VARKSTFRQWPKGMPRRKDTNFDRQLIGRISNINPQRPLPLVHVTTTFVAKEIVSTKKLVTKLCDVFRMELLYFFVLRPAYVPKYGDEPSHHLTRFPSVFVLNPASVLEPLHVYPFDTGGAAKGAFEKQADKLIYLEDYALESNHDAAARFIHWAFGSLGQYYQGRLRQELASEMMPFESVAVSYVDVARLGVDGSNEHDKRASTVEIASSHNVDLPGNLDLLLLPKQFLEGNDALWQQLEYLRAAGTTIEIYDWQPNRRPSEFQRDIMRITREWYERQGVMS